MRALSLFLAVILLVVIITYVEGRGGRGGGGRSGGGRSSSSSRSRSSSSRSSSSRSGGSSRSSRSSKYKSASNFSPAQKKTMKKAALVGVGAYAGYKLVKARNKFRGYGAGWYHVGVRWDYDSWRDLASRDGFLCRDDRDCKWLDPDLECEDRRLTMVPSDRWFGGNSVGIRGNCECRDTAWWDDDDLQCRLWGAEGLAAWAIFLIVMAAAIASCCCCVVCVRKCKS